MTRSYLLPWYDENSPVTYAPRLDYLHCFYSANMVSGVSVQVSDVSNQMTENRKQRTGSVLHPPVFTICLQSSGLSPLKPEH